jgi:hypothetical protein
MRDSSKDSYLSTTAKLAPLFVAKAVLGDFPKALLEKGVESVVAGRGLKGVSSVFRGASGRTLGAIAGVATAAPFMKGLGMAKSDDPSRRRNGLALMAASTTGFQAFKSLAEHVGEHPGRAGVIKGLRSGAVRSLIKTPQAIMLGAALAKSQNSRERGGNSSLAPIVTGALAGGATRAVEGLFDGVPRSSLLRHVSSKAAGGVAGGAIAGLVLDRVVDLAKRRMKEKKAGATATSTNSSEKRLRTGANKGRLGIASLRSQFREVDRLLTERGVVTNSLNPTKRIVIPKEKLDEKSLIRLGFKPVTVAIPEKGQVTSTSYRHPVSLHHVHDHGDSLVIHRDKHPALTMSLSSLGSSGISPLGKRVKGPSSLISTVGSGVSHALTEGVPGLAGYIKSMVVGDRGVKDKVNSLVPEGTVAELGRLRPVSALGGLDGRVKK